MARIWLKKGSKSAEKRLEIGSEKARDWLKMFIRGKGGDLGGRAGDRLGVDSARKRAETDDVCN